MKYGDLFGVTSNKYVAGFIYKIFKTIRKYGGSAVAITQDVSDLFSLDNRNIWKKYTKQLKSKDIFFTRRRKHKSIM